MNFATEPDTLAELIADCAEIPRGPEVPAARQQRPAAPWTVDDACHARVVELDEYV
ncbi:hypothetical protein FHU38_003819 [Saccharomonospora amisosensis]|uniref:Uncharacterized protein n=1 Tax=Saccharomonospora amisosensis TaxID=1128677 RepID=A0A7X5USP9_9PSEU|nr:hypothetical protein [Saccharomonospora amisosensis]NIJ13475.1 hypothetical protein [Saccharomonospora amisosensis]